MRALLVVAAAAITLGMGPSAAQGADDCPNAALRTGSSATLPDCRAWEIVSPAEGTAGSVAFPFTRFDVPTPGAQADAVSKAATDGDAAAYFSYTPFGDPKTGLVASFRSARAADGWVTKMWSPAVKMAYPNLFGGKTLIGATSDDLKVGISATKDPLDPLDQDGDAIHDVYRIAPDGTSTWLSRPNGEGPDATPMDATLANVSADAGVVFFQTAEQLTPDAGSISPGAAMLYRRLNGRTELAAIDDAAAPIGACGAVLGGRGAVSDGAPTQGEVSPDGSRYAFTAPDPFGQYTANDPSCSNPFKVYVRDGDETIDVGRSQRGVSDPGGRQPVYFQGATVDLTSIYFVSNEALTDDAPLGNGENLYRFDLASRALTLISPPDAIGARVTAIPDDGSVIYYVAYVGGVPTLYRYGNGANAVVADFPSFPPDGNTGTYLAGPYTAARTTPDGRYLVVRSRENLTSFDSHGFAEIYRYDAQDASIVCVSCNMRGTAPIGDAALGGDRDHQSPRNRGISSDGQSVFFETKEALDGRDDNAAFDVYEWRAGTGAQLISDGRAAAGSYLFDIARDGRDVFVATTARLVGWDVDNGDYDLYDARQDGGFPEPPEVPTPCRDDQCQGAPTIAPDFVQAQSPRTGGERQASVRAASVAPKVRLDASKTALLKTSRIVAVVKGRKGATITAKLTASLRSSSASTRARVKASSVTGSARVALQVPKKVLASWRSRGGTLTLRLVVTSDGKSATSTLRLARNVTRKGTR